MSRFIDLTGNKYGRLTIIKRVENSKFLEAQWLCKCECGNTKIVKANNLKRGSTKSCGCLKKEQDCKNIMKTTHGKHNTRLYKIFYSMKERCYNENNINYHRYGGRGIKICDEWLKDFMNFYNWAMRNGYQNNLTIDRIDNDGNYEPNNCRWVTKKEQSNNTSRNRYVIYNGEKLTLSQFCEKYNMNRSTIYNRMERGWDIKKAINTPTKK
jgi:hypothetical protein